MAEHGAVSGQAAWEAGYRKSGRRYGRAPPDLPPFPPGTRILEAGCGDGKSLLAMTGRGWDIVAIDFSREAIRISAGQNMLERGRFVQADAAALPFTDGSFDVVSISHILGHLPEEHRSRAASETERILVQGGFAYIRVFSTRDFREGKGILTEPHTYLRGDGIMTHYFSEEEVETLFPTLVRMELSTTEWSMRIKGEHVNRSEIIALFRK